jgi:hypothetical protein
MENKRSYLSEQLESMGGLTYNTNLMEMRPYEIKQGQGNITGLRDIQTHLVTENITVTQPDFNAQNVNTNNFNAQPLTTTSPNTNANIISVYPTTRTSELVNNNYNNYNLQPSNIQTQPNFSQVPTNDYLQSYNNRVYEDVSNFSDDDLSVSGESDDEMAILAMNQVNLNQGTYKTGGIQSLLNNQNMILGGVQNYNSANTNNGNNDVHVQVKLNDKDLSNNNQNLNLGR